MARMAEPHRLTVSAAVRDIADDRLTSEALVRSCLERIEARNPLVEAVTCFDAGRAIAFAQRSDRRPATGVLRGIPFLAKDVLDTAEFPTRYGSPVYEGHRPAADSACVAQATERGAILLGKAATSEFATRTPAPTRNPLRLTHTPGGSSSGPAAAVADFMVPFAYGTQSTGSIVRPASYCGVVGYKPTFGVISSAGLKPISPSQDTVGVLTRSVADAALVAIDLADLPARADEASMPRFALCRSSQWQHANGEMVRQIEGVAASLQALGCARDDVTLDDALEQAIIDQEDIFAFEAHAALAYERATALDRMSDVLRERLARGGEIGLTRYLAMQRRTADVRHRVVALFGAADVLLYPAADGEAEAGLSFSGSPRFGALWTLLHMPSIVIPLGHGPGGLPWGLQLVGRHGDDERLLIAAHKLAAHNRAS